MQITDIKVRKMIPEGRLRAVISITIDNCFAVHDIKVVQGDERLFVAMPSRKDENGVFRDIVHPITPETRASIESQILNTYQEHLAAMQAAAIQAQAQVPLERHYQGEILGHPSYPVVTSVDEDE